MERQPSIVANYALNATQAFLQDRPSCLIRVAALGSHGVGLAGPAIDSTGIWATRPIDTAPVAAFPSLSGGGL